MPPLLTDIDPTRDCYPLLSKTAVISTNVIDMRQQLYSLISLAAFEFFVFPPQLILENILEVSHQNQA